ncbi:MAG: hypothetical protein HFJ84_03595 [Clostridiales bacterium]|jgi:hypothetical protein|nr:hypothetical protein [Clostridiales bacterium]
MIANSKLEQELKAFFKELNGLLLCSEEEKEAIFAGIQESVDEYLDDHPDASMEDIIKRIGTPEDIANSDQHSMGEVAVRQKIKKKRFIALVISSVVFVLGIVALVLTAIYFTKASNELPTHYVASEVVGERPPVPEGVWNDSDMTVA